MRLRSLVWARWIDPKGRTWTDYLSVPEIAPPLRASGNCNGYVYGRCQYGLRRIWVNARAPRDELFSTLCHERLHALMMDDELGADDEERIIQTVEPHLIQLLASLGCEPPPLPVGWKRLREVRR